VVVDGAHHQVEHAPADQDPAPQARLRHSRPREEAKREYSRARPISTASQVKAWKKPSHRVFIRRPGSVVTG
jgi:hypothetical protein